MIPEGLDTTRPRWRAPWAVAEVFAGLGSVAEGFRRGGGFEVAYLNDVDPVARATYQANYGHGTRYDLCDARAVTGRIIADAADGRPVAGLLGCPPCQGWSAAGQRLQGDDRNLLLGDFFHLVRQVDPLFFVMENVPNVADRDELATALSLLSGRYRSWHGVLNSASYGLPQSRQRTIVIGYRLDTDVIPAPPPPTHAGRQEVWDYRTEALVVPTLDALDALLGTAPRLGVRRASERSMARLYGPDLGELAGFVTVGDAIGDLDPENMGPGRSEYARGLGAGITPQNHEPWAHGPEFVARLATVPEGCRPPAAATNGRRYYSQAYTRLHRRGLARTITTNFHNPGSGRFLHYRLHRSLTVREAARLQGFRDDFVFIAPPSRQERVVGNAFPYPWAKLIGRHVAHQLHDVFAV
jgi:DNA (cytosine-5)-methyltransferase 1